MKKIILQISFLLLTIYSYSQEYSLIKKLDIISNSIAVDRFSNIYIVKDYKVIKYNSEAKKLSEFESINNGIVTSIDVTNPLKPILFYKDFNVLTLLDQRFSEINTVNLSEKGLDFIETIAVSTNNSYWVFDNLDFKLKKLDKTFTTIYKSESFLNIFSAFNKPIQIVENNGKVYCLTKKNILVFDSFGLYLKTIAISNVKNFQFLKNKLVYFKNNTLYMYNETTLQTESIKLPLKGDFSKILIQKDLFVLSNDSTIYIYSLE